MIQTCVAAETYDEPARKRSRLASPSPGNKSHSSHPLSILPRGNMLLSSAPSSIRMLGLGSLAPLTDTLVIEVLSLVPHVELLLLSACSKAFFAFARHEQLWKNLYLDGSKGVLLSWHGSWRKSYLALQASPAAAGPLDWPTDSIKTPGLYSDVLYLPYLCTRTPIHDYFFPRRRPRSNIPHHPASTLTHKIFSEKYALPSRPVIITSALSTWPAFARSLWSPQTLKTRFPRVHFRAEALDCTMETYTSYADGCALEDSPLYLFDSRFVEKTNGEMGEEYTPPEVFGQDLFEFMGDERPDYRWLIVGPARSGSTFHKDPNSTSAWNAVLQGKKGWVMFPPDVLPPGVYVSEDEAEVTSPLSIFEWFLSYFDEAWATYGPTARDPKNRGKMMVGVCESNEIFYVPSGWWHLVVNLEFSVAVTQNFVSIHEVGNVLSFMRDKPDQISGFKRAPGSLEPHHCSSLFDRFSAVLRQSAPEALDYGLKQLDVKVRKGARTTLWDSVIKKDIEQDANAQSASSSGFSFSFDLEDNEQ
ncbi:hypothetical protein BOTBODRAFT_380843 [Botryobasidium botryosum FD-172 SS1]|uniref:JmjC domain-containing protein n=1 Tax=Botryobasidium botryosum (strain FD-172 SS1) TaxID=930990 RepID=A0A067MWB8_BOTB1|nr:hypothetical protein BOTBODRAFT_380843 [Botryobasidium botryosum FD-172 SS1]